MATEIQLPQLGLTMTEGLIMEWKKREGDRVKRGEILFNVENDKATIDVAAQVDGMLEKILVQAMITVPVGTVVGRIRGEGESSVESEKEPVLQTEHKPQHDDGFVLASPLARQLADSMSLDMAKLRGTGPEGAVLWRDIPADATAQKTEKPAVQAPPVQISSPGQEKTIEYNDIVLTRIQQVAADRMAESWKNIPQFTLYDEALADAILALADRFKKAGEPVSLTVILAKLLAKAAALYPKVNATWMGSGKLRQYSHVHVNVAMDTPEGLLVPVLRDCASRGFVALGADMKNLADRAKAKSLDPSDHEGGTITLSNLGMFGISRFRAIINPPQTAILAVGRIYEKVVSSAGGFEAKKYIEYSITADHRAVDGAYAARFMASLKSLIENPLLVLD
jgi:pyruvate dehydrogenase E2 component (dihydrolipoamide acetyltransferase)